MVCKLLESIYKLKQSFQAWFERFDTFFLHINFKRTEANPLEKEFDIIYEGEINSCVGLHII
jgi:hypothetical protein